VSTVVPANNSTQIPTNVQIVVSFNEPVDAQSLGEITLTANGAVSRVGPGLYQGSCQGNGAAPGTACAVLSAGNTVLTITPAAALAPNTTYTVTIAGVVDLAGNAMTAPSVTTFTTGTDPSFSRLSIQDFPLESDR
jgi:hypothetical protein